MANKKVNAVSAVKAVNGATAPSTGSTPTAVTSAPNPSSTGTAGQVGQVGTSSAPTGQKPRLPSGFEVLLQKLSQGIESVLPDGWSTTANNGTYTKADMEAQLNGWLAQYADVNAKRQAVDLAMVDLHAAIPQAKAYYAEVKGILTGFFHAGSPLLANFGFKPKKVKATPVVKKAEAVLRGSETRKIRGTLTKAQKAALKFTGQITPAAVASAVTPVTSTAPAAPAQAATPSAPAPATGK